MSDWEYETTEFTDAVRFEKTVQESIQESLLAAYRDTFPTSPLDYNITLKVSSLSIVQEPDSQPLRSIDETALQPGQKLRFTTRVFAGGVPGRQFTGTATYRGAETRASRRWAVTFDTDPSIISVVYCRVIDQLSSFKLGSKADSPPHRGRS